MTNTNNNSGDWNSGNGNFGNWNSGNWNSGNWNSGNWNSGNWNSGNNNSGCLNTNKPKIRIFNKETDLRYEEIVFPDFFYFELTEWVNEKNMSDKEKKDNPNYTILNGYLKEYEYKEAWQKSWDQASAEDREKLFELPNFDSNIFFELTGINVNDHDIKDNLSLSKK